MNSESWHKILTLLTVVIVADKRVYQEEVNKFVQVVTNLNAVISPDIFMTKKMAFDWFVANREDIKNSLHLPDGDIRLKKLINSFQSGPYQTLILRAMMDIAQADNDFHDSEKTIIDMASEVWNVQLA